MKRMRQTTATLRALWPMVGVLVMCGACSHNSTTEPSLTSTTPTTPIASPTVSEVFTSTLPVGGFKFYTFNIAANGTVNVTLNSVSGAGVPATVQLGLGIGQPAGTDCAATSTATAASGSAPQVTGTFGPGLFCVRVFDVGNLFDPANFSSHNRASVASQHPIVGNVAQAFRPAPHGRPEGLRYLRRCAATYG